MRKCRNGKEVSMDDRCIVQDLSYYFMQLSVIGQERVFAGITLGTVAAFFGITESMLVCITLLMLSDLFLGIVRAIVQRQVALVKLQRGAMKFLAYFLSIFLVGVIDVHVSPVVAPLLALLGLSIQTPLMNIYIAYLVVTEVLSVCEHLSILGFKFPPLMQKMLVRYKTGIENVVDKLGADPSDTIKNRRKERENITELPPDVPE